MALRSMLRSDEQFTIATESMDKGYSAGHVASHLQGWVDELERSLEHFRDRLATVRERVLRTCRAGHAWLAEHAMDGAAAAL